MWIKYRNFGTHDSPRFLVVERPENNDKFCFNLIIKYEILS